jgi:holo-[acyl-carrier-protein] synthase
MALKGIGIDIAEISRLSKIAERYGEKFLNKIYTPAEIGLCVRAGGLAGARLAGRWAAKEAFYKALPDGLQPLSSWKSVQILADGRGRPYIDICDERLSEALRGCGVSAIHLSITHERAHCAAVVALE